MSLTLHDYELSADGYKARLLLGFLGLEHARVAVDVYPGDEANGPAFRALNPFGTVPVLQDGAITVRTPEGILIHLAATRDPARRWLPDDPARRSAVMDWLMFAAGPLKAADEARLSAMLRLPPRWADPEAGTRDAFRTLDDHLVRQAIREGFLVGDTATIADLACFPAVVLAVEFGSALEAYPKLRAWTRRIRKMPGFIAMPGIPEFL